MLPDRELLRRYVEDGSQAAFTELVQRHINLVYLAALRRVGGNAHSAGDVTQRVFTDLARKARSLLGHPSLAGWLHTGTRFAAAETVRAERRRRTHEQEAQAMNEINSSPAIPANRLEPFLDEVLDLLDPPDRDVVVLHYLEGNTFAEVGAILSLSADATRMRANRALERLRAGLAKRGIASSAAALAGILAAQSSLAAPAPMAAAVAGRALGQAGAPAGGSSTAARLAHAVKVSPLTPWAGAAIAIAFGVVAIRDLRPSATAAAVPAIQPTAAQTADPVAAPPVSAAGASPAPMAAPTDRPAADTFGDLSAPEKHILKLLWSTHHGFGPQPGTLIVLNVPPEAINADDFAAGREALLAQGLVQLARNGQGVSLTGQGRALCRANDAAIAAYPAFYYPRSGAGPASPPTPPMPSE